jgi:acyl carrier protein
MDKQEIIKAVNNLLVEEFEIVEGKITPEAHLKNDLGLESLDFVDIAVFAKKRFGITLKGREVASIKTMGNLYDYLFDYIQKKQQKPV